MQAAITRDSLTGWLKNSTEVRWAHDASSYARVRQDELGNKEVVAPLVPHNSCSQWGLFSSAAEGHVSWVPASQSTIFLPQQANSEWKLKTTIRQLCQHGHPSPGKHFYSNRRGGANTRLTANTHNAVSNYQAYSNTCHTCTQWGVATPLCRLPRAHSTFINSQTSAGA